MKEKLFAALVILLAILAITYKLKDYNKNAENKENLKNTQNVAETQNLSKENSEVIDTNTSEESNANETFDNEVQNENNGDYELGSYDVNPNIKNKVVTLTKENFDSEVLKSDKTVIVDFYADWCGPCKALSPILEEIAKENTDIKVCKLNVDLEQELAIKYGAQYLPTVLIVKNGKVEEKIIGLQEKSYILEKCN